MRYGRKEDRQRVIWLVKFLEVWCDSAEIERRITDYVRNVEKGALDEQTKEFFAQVYSHFKEINPEARFLLKESAPRYVAKHIDLSDEEFDALFDKYLYNEDWRPFVKMISGNSRALTASQMGRLRDLLEDPEEILKRKRVAREVTALIDTDAGMLIMMYYAIFCLSYFSREEARVIDIVEAFTTMTDFVLSKGQLDKFKVSAISLFIVYLILSNYIILALSVLNKIRAEHE
jgi:hypothetical protein